jgi:hypothetical protein
MFSYVGDKPHPADVEKFLSEDQLTNWWSKMQRKFPQVFREHDPCPQQHAAGTKLIFYFDNDSNERTCVEVVGSKFRNEMGEGECAFYVVRYKGTGQLAFIHWAAAHEPHVWQVGWDSPPRKTRVPIL